jgi:hypothetical protein
VLFQAVVVAEYAGDIIGQTTEVGSAPHRPSVPSLNFISFTDIRPNISMEPSAASERLHNRFEAFNISDHAKVIAAGSIGSMTYVGEASTAGAYHEAEPVLCRVAAPAEARTNLDNTVST